MLAALYVSGPACATDEAPPAAVQIEPHIALLLPLKSPVFGRAAGIVQQGFMAAANNQPLPLPIIAYATDSESQEVAALYPKAIANGAVAVAGPLTRDGVAALAAATEISVPTLALNVGEMRGLDQLYFFGLSAEAEARQVAQLAAAAGLRGATLVSTGTPLSARLSQAFAAEWKTLGGDVLKELTYGNNPEVLADLPDSPGNMVFLAADAAKARMIHPYIDIAIPVYAISQLFNGNTDTLTNYDLNNTRFVDMPWLLQPEHPAVMVYPRPEQSLEPDMERLYALGIDAFRLLQIMLNNTYRTELPLDGVTGQISLNSNHQFLRKAIPAQIRQGRGQPLDTRQLAVPPNDRSLTPVPPLPGGEGYGKSLREINAIP
ncbi:MAG: LppC family lipoprotein [Gallionellaceae bacterium]|nr:MAG: LppC family lipoprotein [Gallionellaceae bacterium]